MVWRRTSSARRYSFQISTPASIVDPTASPMPCGEHGGEQAARALAMRAHRRPDCGVDVLAQRLTLPRHRLQPLPEFGDVRGRAIVGQIHDKQRDQPIHVRLGAGIQALPLDAGHRVIVGEGLENRSAAFRQGFLLGQLVDRLAVADLLGRAGRRRDKNSAAPAVIRRNSGQFPGRHRKPPLGSQNAAGDAPVKPLQLSGNNANRA